METWSNAKNLFGEPLIIRQSKVGQVAVFKQFLSGNDEEDRKRLALAIAAPDLLEASQVFVNLCTHTMNSGLTVIDAKNAKERKAIEGLMAAIKKATQYETHPQSPDTDN